MVCLEGQDHQKSHQRCPTLPQLASSSFCEAVLRSRAGKIDGSCGTMTVQLEAIQWREHAYHRSQEVASATTHIFFATHLVFPRAVDYRGKGLLSRLSGAPLALCRV